MIHDRQSGVLLEGDGIAAACIARLLADAGTPFLSRPNTRPKLAAILLGEQTQHLLRELFPATIAHPADLFEGFVQIGRRVVLWGNAPEVLELPHNGVVAPEAELLRRLWERGPALQAVGGTSASKTAWTILTSRDGAADRPELNVGSRHARFALAELAPGIVPDACWVESVPGGWLFLLAVGDGNATLIAVGDTADALLSESRLVSAQIARVLPGGNPVAAYPRLTGTLATAGAITCGSAATSFDPLCGEGAGNAVREAFLAAAMVRAALDGQPDEALAEHYSDRLRRGFLRHLQVCLQFYATGGDTVFWQAQAASLVAGIAEVQQALAETPASQFRLIDRDLVPVQPA